MIMKERRLEKVWLWRIARSPLRLTDLNFAFQFKPYITDTEKNYVLKSA